MLATRSDEIKVVQDSLRGLRPVDESTLASVDVLGERLARLKQSSRLFAGVAFSDHVHLLAGRNVVSVAG